MDEDLSDLLDAMEVLGNGSFLDFAKKLKHYDVDRNERVSQLRNELKGALLQSIEDDEGNYDFAYYHLERTWQRISPEHSRDDRHDKVTYEPIDALFSYIRSGYYPPPELLLLLQERFDVYMAGEGELSLEEVFFGPPHRNAGNFAARSGKETSGFAFKLIEGRSQGLSQIEAAEKYIEENNLHVEPESLVRSESRRKKKFRKFFSDK
jgi:hypothetical protein